MKGYGRKKLLGLAYAFLVIMLALAPQVIAAPAKVEISVLLDPATFGNEYLNWLAETWIPVFEKENPDIKVNLTILSGNRLDTVAVAVAGGMPYDIVTAPHTLPMIEGVGKGWYLPLDSYIAKWKDAAQMIPAVWAHTRWKGVTYAIPNHLPPRVMAYNKNLFAQAGINPNKPPASWDEMLTVARRLTRTDGDKLVQRGFHILTDATEYELFAANTACPILSEDYRKPLFNQACGLDTLNFMKQMYEINNPVGYSSSLPSSANTGFYTGKAAMIRVAGASVATQVAAKYSDMVDMQIFLPQRSAAYQPATTSSVNSLAILRFTKHPDEAWRVMAHLNRRESLEQLAMLRGQQIPRYDVVPFAAKQMPETVPFYEVLDYLVPRPKWPSGAGYTYNSALGEPVGSAILGKEAPESALAEAERRVQLLLDDFWRTAI